MRPGEAPGAIAEAGAGGLLRLITCGSVDDGKSTLLGRLLHDAGAITPDQRAALLTDTQRSGGGRTGQPDYALLFDGLEAERAQGITIDVAYRYFATARRSFIVADAPGHDDYTRNMVTGASTADLAIVLVDARRGITTQTRRHAHIAALLGIRRIVLAVTKMDLIDWDRDRFADIVRAFADFSAGLAKFDTVPIPLSAVDGGNVATPLHSAAWYIGPTLLDHLETVPIAADLAVDGPACLPVQWVCRADGDFRGYAGTLARGRIAPGARVRILPSGRATQVARIVAPDGDWPWAIAGQATMLTLADPVDCARGDMIVADDAPLDTADRFEASLIWLDGRALVPGRGYWLQLATQRVRATVQPPKYAVSPDTLDHLAAKTLRLNEIGVAEVATDRPIAFTPYADNRTLGGFILIDRESGATVAAGMLHFALRRATSTRWQPLTVTRDTRAAALRQRPAVVWLTGLSGAGKSTIADLIEQRLQAEGRHTFLLDGDNLRRGLTQDLGFTEADRIENIRRAGEVARLMADAGLIVIAAFISPFRAERALVRTMLPPGEFVEVHVDTPLSIAEARDPKGLYARARAGELLNFTGIDSPYEPPEQPDIRIDTTTLSADDAAARIVDFLLRRER